MTATNRIAILVASAALGLAGCQPQRTKPASASLAPDAVVGTVASSVRATGRAADDASTTPQDQSSLPIGLTSSEGRPATGRRCRVHLRRDAMGLATVSPLPMTSRSASPAARATQLEGVIEVAGERWITLRTTDRVYSLPVGSILAIEYLDAR